MNGKSRRWICQNKHLKESIDKVCRTKTYTVTALKAVPEVSKEDNTGNNEGLLGHSPTGVSRPKQLSDEQHQEVDDIVTLAG